MKYVCRHLALEGCVLGGQCSASNECSPERQSWPWKSLPSETFMGSMTSKSVALTFVVCELVLLLTHPLPRPPSSFYPGSNCNPPLRPQFHSVTPQCEIDRKDSSGSLRKGLRLQNKMPLGLLSSKLLVFPRYLGLSPSLRLGLF